MKTLLTIVTVMLAMTLYGQHYDYGKLDTTIYNPETGQYWYRSQQFKKSENIFSSEEYFMADQIRHRLQIETGSIFAESKTIGAWCFASYSKPVIKKEWVKKGYWNYNSYFLNLGMGIRYEKDSSFCCFVGAGGSISMRYVGPAVGFKFKREKVKLEATAVYSLACFFKESYSEEWQQKHADYIAQNGLPPTIKGFDPNSWYRISFQYKVDNVSSIGLTSERFYGTRFSYSYEPNINGLHWKEMTLNSSLGWDFEFKHFIGSLGMSINIF